MTLHCGTGESNRRYTRCKQDWKPLKFYETGTFSLHHVTDIIYAQALKTAGL